MQPTGTPLKTAPAARLEVDGKSVELPVVVGTEHEIGIDIQKLRAQTGAITLDPGFGNTGSCTSAITSLRSQWNPGSSARSTHERDT